MLCGIVSKSATSRETASDELTCWITGPDSAFLSRNTSHRGSQLKHRCTLKVSVGSTSSANSPFKDKVGLSEASAGKWLTASGSSFTGVGKPHARIPVLVRDRYVQSSER